MSGIYIPGMEMPTKCEDCILDHKFFKWLDCHKLNITECLNEGTRHKDCPLVPVHDHGRLIDADAIEAEFEKLIVQDNWYYNALHHAPTIVPADHFANVDKMVADKEETE